MLKRRLDYWLPTYALTAPSRLAAKLSRGSQLTHLIFLVCDHFEPRHAAKTPEQPFERMQTWKRSYPALQERVRSAYGTTPLHSWFYPPHHGEEHLQVLSEMVFDGGGEVELHYHHKDDTAPKLRADLQRTIAKYNRWGLLLETGAPPRTSFGFIHGDWALDNSGHGQHCGVNGELSLLASLGCWGDMTMPSANECQTRKINAIYYAKDDPSRCKSHDWGPDARVGQSKPEGFWLMQGPLGINWRAPGYPRIENASLTTENWGRPDRIKSWIDCNVHVQGRPDWLFIKLHTHGGVDKDFPPLFGELAWQMHKELNEHYNDGKRYKLHYVTARQAYNLAKAAEHGHGGDPTPWLDFVIPKQTASFYTLSAEHRLLACTPERLELDDITPASPAASVTLRTRIGTLRSLGGPLQALAVDAARGEISLTSAAPQATFTLDTDAATGLQITAGDARLLPGAQAGQFELHLPAGGSVKLRSA